MKATWERSLSGASTAEPNPSDIGQSPHGSESEIECNSPATGEEHTPSMEKGAELGAEVVALMLAILGVVILVWSYLPAAIVSALAAFMLVEALWFAYAPSIIPTS